MSIAAFTSKRERGARSAIAAPRPRWVWRGSALLIAWALAVAAPETSGAAPRERRAEAKAHFDKGRQAFDAGQFTQALKHYRAAYAIASLPDLLFNIGQCHRNIGEHEQAIAAFQGYLDALPRAPNRQSVEKLIAELRQRAPQPAAPTTHPDAGLSPRPTPASPANPTHGNLVDLGEPDLDDLAGVGGEEGGHLVASAPPPPPTATPQPLYRKWWFWTAVSAALLGGAATGIYFATRSGGPDLPQSRLPTWELPNLR